jgi:uncharacterized protein
MTQVAFPYRLDARGRTAQATDHEHVRDLIEQVLFTNPGERVLRPNFGSGLLQLVFAANDGEVAAATKFLVEGALQQWLGEIVTVQRVGIQHQDGRLVVDVQYTLRRTNEAGHARFARSL